MNNYEKFEQIYSKIVDDNVENLEISRRNAQGETFENVITLFLEAIIGFILYYLSYEIFYPYDEITQCMLLIYIVIAIFIYKKIQPNDQDSKILKYKDDFKTKVIKNILESFGENIRYYPYQGIDQYSYTDAEFEFFKTYKSEDLMQGILKNNCRFSMAEVLTEYEKKDENGDPYYSTLFCGIVSKVETPKPFNATLYLKKDVIDNNILTKTFTKKSFLDKQRVELDSQEFEEIFDVYCSDKIIAMQLLTADIMQLLVEFQEEMNMDYELTIKNNHIYIRFMSGEMFENNNVMKYSLNKKQIYKYYRMIDFALTLTDKLINLIKDTEYDI